MRYAAFLATQGVHIRNLLVDADAAGLSRPSQVTFVNVEIDEHGDATFDEILLFSCGRCDELTEACPQSSDLAKSEEWRRPGLEC